MQLDEKIKKLIQEESEKEQEYKNRVDEITETLKNTSIPYRKKKEMEDEKYSLEKKIEDIETNNMFSEYICISQKIVSEYIKTLSIPKNVSFFSKKKADTVDDSQDNLIEEFLDIAKKYIPIKTYKKEVQKSLSCGECGNTSDFIHSENTVTCENCGNENKIYTIQTNFKDIDRVNLSQKYKYSKKVYFKEIVSRYEGKQNKKILPKVYIDVDDWLEKHNLLIESDTYYGRHINVTKEHLYMALSETGHNLHYEDINLLHYQFTGKPCPDISDIRNDLFDDFDKVMDAYESLDIDRIKSLNGQYILYQLLRRRNVKVDEKDFAMLKTRDKLIEYDEIYEQVAMINEWSFKRTV